MKTNRCSLYLIISVLALVKKKKKDYLKEAKGQHLDAKHGGLSLFLPLKINKPFIF